jgi:hypothetical protein
VDVHGNAAAYAGASKSIQRAAEILDGATS